jgi:hypothetical protein
MNCKLCLIDHDTICDCGHKHEDHIFASGCKIKKCPCDRYSQKLQLTEKDLKK